MTVVAAGLGALSMFFIDKGHEPKPAAEAIVVKKAQEKPAKSANLAAARKRLESRKPVPIGGDEAARQKPTFAVEDEEELNLTEEQRKLIEEIRKALDMEDKKTVVRLVQRMQASDEWPDGIPKSIRMAAIEALGWFGVSCLPEIAGFLADADAEVLQTAVEKYEEALSDFDLSDRERSLILIQAAKVITDADAMDSMLFELNNMRHSVAVETIKELMVSGSDATKSVLPDNIEFYTGEEEITTAEQLDEWLEENPDDEDDEEFYGGSSDDSES